MPSCRGAAGGVACGRSGALNSIRRFDPGEDVLELEVLHGDNEPREEGEVSADTTDPARRVPIRVGTWIFWPLIERKIGGLNPERSMTVGLGVSPGMAFMTERSKKEPFEASELEDIVRGSIC